MPDDDVIEALRDMMLECSEGSRFYDAAETAIEEIERLRPYEEAAHNVADMAMAADEKAANYRKALDQIAGLGTEVPITMAVSIAVGAIAEQVRSREDAAKMVAGIDPDILLQAGIV